MVTNESVKFHTNNNAINPVVGDRVKFIDMDRGDATFLCLNCICQTGGNQRRIEATVNQPLGWIFHPPIRGELGHDWKTNVREYTQRDSDSARGGIEQLPDHLSISSESAPVRLGEPVQRTLAAAPNRSQVKAWLFSLSLSLSSSFSFFSFLLPLFFSSSTHCITGKKHAANSEKDRKKNLPIISLSVHFSILVLLYFSPYPTYLYTGLSSSFFLSSLHRWKRSLETVTLWNRIPGYTVSNLIKRALFHIVPIERLVSTAGNTMERWKTISRSVVERKHGVVIGVCEARLS